MIEKKRGLHVIPILKQSYRPFNKDERQEWCDLHPEVEWHFVEYLPKKDDGSPDWAALCKMYVEMVKELNIEVLVGSTNDDNAIVHSYIADNCPTVQGPSMESVILCNNKIYCRQHIIPEELNIRYCAIDLDSEIDVDGIIDACGLPMMLKPACEAASTLVHAVSCKEELEQALVKFKENITGSYFTKFGTVLSGLEEKYPFLKQRVIIAEEFVNSSNGECNILTTEVGVNNDEVIPWLATDNIYWPSNPQCFLGCGTPSIQPAKYLKTVWEHSTKIAKNLSKFGFNKSLFNIEFFIWLDGNIRAMEINPRLFYQVQPLYKAVYLKGDHLTAMIDMQLGKQVTTPIPKFKLELPNAPRYALNSYISTKKGGLAKEIYNYKKAAEYAEELKDMRWVMHLKPPNQLLVDAQSGNTFAWIYTTGESFSDCQQQAREVSIQLLGEEHHNSLWEDSFDWHAIYAERSSLQEKNTAVKANMDGKLIG